MTSLWVAQPRTSQEGQVIFGYLDAGTGSLLVQLLVGGLAGIATFVKFRWGTVKGWFSKAQKTDQ
jgi:hypothetical protein